MTWTIPQNQFPSNSWHNRTKIRSDFELLTSQTRASAVDEEFLRGPVLLVSPRSPRLLLRNMKRNRYCRASARTLSACCVSAILALEIVVLGGLFRQKERGRGSMRQGKSVEHIHRKVHVATLYLPAAKVTHTHTQSEWAQPSGPSDTSQGMKGILFESLLSFAGCHREFKLSGSFPQKYPQLFHLVLFTWLIPCSVTDFYQYYLLVVISSVQVNLWKAPFRPAKCQQARKICTLSSPLLSVQSVRQTYKA